MLEHLSEDQFERYRRRTMPPAELLTTDDHLARCEVCRQRLNTIDQQQAASAFLQADLEAVAGLDDHLAYEQLAAYIDDALDDVDRDIVESHLEICQPCATEADDLRAFAVMTRAGPVQVYAPPSLREKFLARWRLPARWTPRQLAATTVALALVLAGMLVVWRSIAPGRARQQKVATSPPAPPAQTPPAIPQPSAQTVLALNDGGRRVTLDSRGVLAGLESLPTSYQEMVKTTLMALQVATPPILKALIGRARRQRSGTGDEVSFALLSPVGTVVQTDRPTFRWQPLSGATMYTVEVFDAKSDEVDHSPPLSQTKWTATRPLKRGRIYTWRVVALKDGDEVVSPAQDAPQVKFKVLEQEKAKEIEHAKQTYPDLHLTLGILYAQAGLLDDAEREFQQLYQTNPDSPAAHKLLESLQEQRHSR